eukprot:gene1386-biopygen4791
MPEADGPPAAPAPAAPSVGAETPGADSSRGHARRRRRRGEEGGGGAPAPAPAANRACGKARGIPSSIPPAPMSTAVADWGSLWASSHAHCSVLSSHSRGWPARRLPV